MKINSFQDGALLIEPKKLYPDDYDYENNIIDYHQYLSPPSRLLLNLQIEEQREKLIRGTNDALSYMNSNSISRIMRVDTNGELQVKALWLGSIETHSCSTNGKCYFVGSSPFRGDSTSSVWYSANGGDNWQQLKNWTFPAEDSLSEIHLWKIVKAEDNGQIWLADDVTLYSSTDQGRHWQRRVDTAAFLKRNGIHPHYTEEGNPLSKLNWLIDNQQHIVADVEFLARYDDGLRERRFLYLLNGKYPDEMLGADINAAALSADGNIFFTQRGENYARYGLYRLQDNGMPEQVLEHIDRLSSIKIGLNSWFIGKGSGDAFHWYVSYDKGEQWRRMRPLSDEALFDNWHDRFLKFSAHSQSETYWTTDYR
ncbi:TPA: WD40/YVTN/BNR-like repeat-containing protein [Enterobacter cancerogenus]